MTRRIVFASLYSLLVAGPAFAQPSPAIPTPATPATEPTPAEPTTATPVAPTSDPWTAPAPPHATDSHADAPVTVVVPDHPLVRTKWDTTLYGFVEADSIYDSTQGLTESIGNGAIPRPNTYAGDHGEMTYGARNSRIGFRFSAPDYDGIRTSGQIEGDFLGNQPGKPFDATGLVSEAAFFQNPTFRIRHMNVKLESDYVDVLIGQYWELFGWQSYFHPNTVEIQGVPGQIYSRTPQIRLSKTIKTDGVNVDIAVAALRPPERASATPDLQGGLKLTVNKYKAWHTAGATGTALDGAAIGVSGVFRHFAVDEFSATPHSQVTANGNGVAVDALIPIVSANKDSHANALTLTAEYVHGTGIADLYTGLNGGVSNPALPNPAMKNPAPAYTADIDPGLAQFTLDAAGNATLHTVDFESYIVGLQYYLPPSGRVWLSVNASHIDSDNDGQMGAVLGTATKVWTKESWYSGNLFFDVTPAARLGLEYALYDMTFADGTEAKDKRVQFSGFFIF